MAYEIFTTSKRETRLLVTIRQYGHIGLHKPTAALLRDKAVERVYLMWDKQANKIAFKATDDHNEPRGHSISYYKGEGYATIYGHSFLLYIGYDYSISRTFTASWNESEKMLEMQIPRQLVRRSRGCQKNDGCYSMYLDLIAPR